VAVNLICSAPFSNGVGRKIQEARAALALSGDRQSDAIFNKPAQFLYHVNHFNLPALDGLIGVRTARNVPTKLFAGRSLVELMRRKATGTCHFGCVWMVGTIEKRCGISRAFDNLIQSQFHNSIPPVCLSAVTLILRTW
jgi:hypothetical protein